LHLPAFVSLRSQVPKGPDSARLLKYNTCSGTLSRLISSATLACASSLNRRQSNFFAAILLVEIRLPGSFFIVPLVEVYLTSRCQYAIVRTAPARPAGTPTPPKLSSYPLFPSLPRPIRKPSSKRSAPSEVETRSPGVLVEHLDRVERILGQVPAHEIQLVQNVVRHRYDMAADGVGLENV